jgi:hypothetical protein
MTNVIALKNKTTIEGMIDEIHREFAAATADTKRADRARLRAGKLLLKLRKRIEDGEEGEGVNWWKWYGKNIARSKKDAMKVMKLASATDPEAAHEQEKTATKDRMAKGRAAHMRDQSTVEHILCLIEQLSEESRQQLFAELRSIYAYQHQNRRNG